MAIDIVHHLWGESINIKDIGLWTDLVTLGLVLIVLGGQPRETWEAARMNQLVDSDGIAIKGPRALRSIEQLGDLLCPSQAETRHVAIGSVLFRAMIHLFLPIRHLL